MIAQLDGSLKAELIQHVDALAQSPAEHVWPAKLPDQHDAWMYTYASQVVEETQIMLWFVAYDESTRTMTLVAMGSRHQPPSR